jgi:methanogenic corrinoid protein MtbC1
MGVSVMDAFSFGSGHPTLMVRQGGDISDDSASDSRQPPVLTPLLSQRRRIPVRQRPPLARAVVEEVVPLLVLAHRASTQARVADPCILAAAEAGPEACIAALARLATANDLSGALALIEDLHAAGHALDTIYLEVITGAARRLGLLWHEDKASFADVTIGVLMLQRLVHALDHAFCGEVVRRDPGRRMLLTPRPGEPHGFAIDVVSAFLRRAGWEVASAAPRSDTALCALVRSEWFAVVGISDTCGEDGEALAASIHAVRRASRNRNLRVMVGGPRFAADPELAMRVGADATAIDARHAVTQAEGLFALCRREG